MAGAYSCAQVMDSERAGAKDSGGEAAAAWDVTGTAAQGHGTGKDCVGATILAVRLRDDGSDGKWW